MRRLSYTWYDVSTASSQWSGAGTWEGDFFVQVFDAGKRWSGDQEMVYRFLIHEFWHSSLEAAWYSMDGDHRGPTWKDPMVRLAAECVDGENVR